MPDPLSGDIGGIVNGNFLPLTPPLSYTPSKGEVGLAVTSETGGNVFLPIEPISQILAGLKDEYPFLVLDQPIDREPPYNDQSDMSVATPCVSPYNWTASVADRTIILDTVPDALATPTEKALPGYVANPGLTVSSRTHREYDLTKYDDTDGVAYLWTYGTSPATPHPALRAGQTRYGGISGAAVGTAFDGTPFIPGTAGSIVNGNLKISAYRYGLLLSSVPTYGVKVKIGRATATWSKSGQTLTLATDTTSATIKYTLNGGALTTYSTPISITDTATVVWYAEKTGMVTSDTWSTYVEYADAAPPDNFSTVYFSSLPTFSNSPIKAAVQFQRRPDFYITPTGTGDGLTPSTPSNATTVIGLTSAPGLAVGVRSITTAKSGTAAIQLTRGGANPSGSTMKYSLDKSTWTTYSTPVNHTAPGRVWFKLERSGGTALSPVWMRPWFIGTGTGVQINAVWSQSAQTLTLTYEPTPLVASDVTVKYSLDGSAPSLVYTGPISITANCTPRVKAVHPVDTGTPSDFAASTGVYDCTSIDITSTPDYDEDHAATWTADATVASYTFSRDGDLVWCSEGTYTNPTGTASTYFSSNNAIVHVKGGYSTDFTERNVQSRKTIFNAVAWSSPSNGINDYCLSAATIDGVYTDTELVRYDDRIKVSGMLLGALFNCHMDVSLTTTGGVSETMYVGGGSGMYYCTMSFKLSIGDATATYRNNALTINAFTVDAQYCNFALDVSAGDAYGTGSGTGGLTRIFCTTCTALGVGNTVSVKTHTGLGGNGTYAGDSRASVTFGSGLAAGNDITIEAVADGSGTGSGYGGVVLSRADVTVSGSNPGGNVTITANAGPSTADSVLCEITSAIGINTTSNLVAVAGDAAGTSIARVTANGGYRPKLTGSATSGTGTSSRGYLVWAVAPAYFESGDVTFTESAPYGNGNPVRVDHSTDSTTGWYSGLDNGNGAPLAGYETPQGTGVALGRYWE